jgi:RNA chaperone Hfq
MKDPERSEGEGITTRKLVRPALADVSERTLPSASTLRPGVVARKQAPPEQTNAENYYFVKQMQAKTPMVVVLTDGTELRGWIEWYDKDCIKLNRHDGPNLMIYKHSIRYMFKEEELRYHRRRKVKE